MSTCDRRIGFLITMAAVGVMMAACQSDGNDAAAPATTSAAAVATTSPATTSPAISDVPSVTANVPEDLGQACAGTPIRDAPEYDPTEKPRVFIARSIPGDKTFEPYYTNKTKPYSVNALQWRMASVVACLFTVPGSAKAPLNCHYKKQDGSPVTIKRIAYTMEIIFYAAATGERLGSGGRVKAPVECPQFMLYQQTVYGFPDEPALLAAIDKFVSARG
jgi:hypothetical protein